MSYTGYGGTRGGSVDITISVVAVETEIREIKRLPRDTQLGGRVR